MIIENHVLEWPDLTNQSFPRIKNSNTKVIKASGVSTILENEEKEEISFSSKSLTYYVCLVSMVDCIGFYISNR